MTKPKQCDISMYKSLCICSPEFERIPIDRRDLGTIRITISYTLTYNHRFKQIVAKGQSDDKGKLAIHNVYAGKEDTIDKLSFITDKNNFNERVS